jgi:hypothetical protein
MSRYLLGNGAYDGIHDVWNALTGAVVKKVEVV